METSEMRFFRAVAERITDRNCNKDIREVK